MTKTETCPQCGTQLPANAPAGICPKCLLRAGVELGGEPPADPSAKGIAPTTPPRGRFGPPDPAELAPYFPNLEIAELLGHGGMGAVYKARQTKLDRLVALKIIRPESADDPSFAERFNREARTLARLNHPNIVGVHDFGEVQIALADDHESTPRTLYYFLMEYVDGANLRQVLQAGELPAERALVIVPQLCEALQFAHDEGIIHRDIKPENILVDTKGQVKIADFGLAKLLSDDVADHNLTGTHQVMGTPRYMAPEQMEGARSVDHRADIYSLGVVFYEMLTGELPLGRFAPPSQKASVDVDWDQIVMRALENEPRKRYQQASEVKTDIERISDHDRPQHRTSDRAAAFGRVTAPSSTVTSPTIPHYGMLLMGGVMTLLGIGLMLWSTTGPAAFVFAFVGLGLALGGGGCFASAYSDKKRLPAGTRSNHGMLMQGGVMVLLGTALLVYCGAQESGPLTFGVGNAAVWIGIGLVLGGGGCFSGSWKNETEQARSRSREAARSRSRVAANHAGSVPNYGWLIMGGVMVGFGLPMLAIAILTSAHLVFAWIGIGVALGGGGCCALFFVESGRLPAGTGVNLGLLTLGGIMGLVGLAILIASPIAGDGFLSIHPSNVFIWVGMGLWLGGGGCFLIAWEVKRPKPDRQLEKPAKPMHDEATGWSDHIAILTTVLAIIAPVTVALIVVATGPWLRNWFADFELTLPKLSQFLLAPAASGVATGVAIISTTLTIVLSIAGSRTLSVGWNLTALILWAVLLMVYLLAGIMPVATLIQGLS